MNPLLWDDVRYFLALSRQGSLSATARFLDVEHTTVARRVTQLEQSLELKLFDRLARGWVLTEEGALLLDEAHAIEERMLALQRTARAQTSLTGTVRISAPSLLLNYFLLPHLGSFREKYPELDLHLIGEIRMSNMGRAEADIALRIIAQPEELELVARPLGDIHYGLYGTKKTIEQTFEDQVFIGFDESLSKLPQKQWLDQFIGSRRYALYCNDFMTMYQAARLGFGIALLPHILATTDNELHALQTHVFSRPVHLVMHPDIRRAPKVRVTADFLIDVFNKRLN